MFLVRLWSFRNSVMCRLLVSHRGVSSHMCRSKHWRVYGSMYFRGMGSYHYCGLSKHVFDTTSERSYLSVREWKCIKEDKVRSSKTPEYEHKPVQSCTEWTQVKPGVRNLREVYEREWLFTRSLERREYHAWTSASSATSTTASTITRAHPVRVSYFNSS
jgi:hypothetical protein